MPEKIPGLGAAPQDLAISGGPLIAHSPSRESGPQAQNGCEILSRKSTDSHAVSPPLGLLPVEPAIGGQGKGRQSLDIGSKELPKCQQSVRSLKQFGEMSNQRYYRAVA